MGEKAFREAALAPNWLQVLAVDAGLGLVILSVGVVLAAVWLTWAGVMIALVGGLYIALVGRRLLQWRWLRQQSRDAGAL